MIQLMLLLAVISGELMAERVSTQSFPAGNLTIESLTASPHLVIPADGSVAPDSVRIELGWDGNACQPRVQNNSSKPLRVREIELFSIKHGLPPETRIYGESFQMLSQTGGTIAEPIDLGSYTDRKHYRIPQVPDATTVYSLLILSPPAGEHILMAFTSCRRFSGLFRLRRDHLQVVLDAENLELRHGQTWELEEFILLRGPDRESLLASLADRLNVHHPRLQWPSPPTGWCSWYCFKGSVTAKQILDTAAVVARDYPGLKYIQIDDGYESALGDWLETRSDFGQDAKSVCKSIQDLGLQVGIWVGPFIAEENSRVFREHPDWFIRDEQGKPLRSDRVSFGGWRHGPWYALDGTHPDAQMYLERVFRTMRREWGCTYFKLDGNFWGTLHGGRLHDPNATRIEAYRRGMQAVLRGAGDAFVLGCNHPIWPSLGLIHASRSSNDIDPPSGPIARTAAENLFRNWQNGRLWFNDPDVLLLSGLPASEAQFRASVVLASGGLVLSGNDLTKLPPERGEILRRLSSPNGIAARFDDSYGLGVGRIDLPNQILVCLFNWTGRPQDLSFDCPQDAHLVDFWTGQEVPVQGGRCSVNLPPQSARVIKCPRPTPP